MRLMSYVKLIRLLLNNGFNNVNEWRKYMKCNKKHRGIKLPLWYKLFMLIRFNDRIAVLEYEKGIFSKGFVYSFDDVFNEYDIYDEDHLTWMLKNKYVPFSDDGGGGDYYVFDFKNNRVLLMYHDELYGFEVVHEDIENFIKTLKYV